MIVAIIITATLCLASCEPSEDYIYPGTVIVTEEPFSCHDIDSAAISANCYDRSSTLFPTKMRADFDNFTALKLEFSNGWVLALGIGLPCPCLDVLRAFVCFSYFPQCSIRANDVFVVYPCQELCEAVTAECKDVFLAMNYKWPSWIEDYNCSSLRSSGAGHLDCVPEPAVTCPTSDPPTRDPSTTDPPTRDPSTTDPPTQDPSSCDEDGDSNETRESCNPVTRVVTPSTPSCITLENEFCSSSFNYASTAPSSYRSGHLTNSSQYNKEFNDFRTIIEAETPCSDYIKTFFCFTYFPYCQTVGERVELIYPCSEVCENVLGENSRCRAEIHSLLGYLPPWLESYDCNTLVSNSNSTTGGCASGPDPSSPTEILSIPTESPCTTSCSFPTPCTEISCNYRQNANGGTFYRNDFSFAAKVIFLSEQSGTDSKSYSVGVVELYELESVDDGAVAPPMGNTIYTNIPIDCDNCDFNVQYGVEYLIAGYYTLVDGCDEPCFKLPAHDSLVTRWDETKHGRKIDKWIRISNDRRRVARMAN